MARILTNVDVKIVPRMATNGHPFTELLHSWVEGGQRRNSLSRVAWFVSDTPHIRAYQIEAFKKRQLRN
ncbi:hypothetical protein GGD67_003868 [Bradyrhizobium sp. IAR9]|uniref:hypothetical protein n=1 Tax=Bradyrhizobium sp. IAR9 TaxID=2663841 RepID=UPI0015C918F4|nr:hypothetical protein [Bradyrhizobium sp. IAR9]NYG46397.1 hypothetical protein [Bradyrhizobium sp. IAR9]